LDRQTRFVTATIKTQLALSFWKRWI